MKLHTLKSWQVDLAGGLALALLSLIAYLTIYRPIEEKQLILSSLHASIDVQESRAGQLSESCRTFEEQIKRDRNMLKAQAIELRPATALNRRLADITDAVTACGMTLHESQTSLSEPGPLYDLIGVTLTGSGTYPQAAALMHRLTEQMDDVGVAGFELTGNPRMPGGPAVFRFDLVWYAAPASSKPAD